MLFKIIAVVLLLLIAGSLFAALRSLLRGDNDATAEGGGSLKPLNICMGLTVLLLLLLALFNQLGWLEPHSINPHLSPSPDQSDESSQREDSGSRYRAP